MLLILMLIIMEEMLCVFVPQSACDLHRLRGSLRRRLHQEDHQPDEAAAAGDRQRAARCQPGPGRVLQGLQRQGHQGVHTQAAGDGGRHQRDAHLPGMGLLSLAQ